MLGTPLEPPFPEDTERAVFGMGCFWGAERIFWQAPGVYTTAAGYAAGFTPNPTYEEVCSGRTGHNEVVLVVFRPAELPYEELLRLFWEGHDPTQGMRQGNDVGTQYRSGIYTDSEAQAEAARASRDAYARAPQGRRLRRDHHRDRAGGRLLLRRGLPPAVPREEPRRLLRHRRHGRVLPGRRGRRLRQRAAASRRPISRTRSSACAGQRSGSGSHHAHSSCSSSATGSEVSATVASPTTIASPFGMPHQRLDAQAAGLELPLLAQLARQGLGRALAQVHRAAGAERPAARPGGHPAGATAGQPAAVLGAHDAERGEAVARHRRPRAAAPSARAEARAPGRRPPPRTTRAAWTARHGTGEPRSRRASTALSACRSRSAGGS